MAGGAGSVAVVLVVVVFFGAIFCARNRRASAAILELSGIHAMPFSLDVGGIKRLIFALAFHRAINASSILS